VEDKVDATVIDRCALVWSVHWPVTSPRLSSWALLLSFGHRQHQHCWKHPTGCTTTQVNCADL